MEEKIFFSIIVPIYNVNEIYLRKAIESIVNQKFTEERIEIILVNDGSTNNSLNICKEYKKIDKRIQIINQKNQGSSEARNAGIEIAKGEWIAFVDADDWVENNMCKVMYKYAKKHKETDIIIFSNYTNYKKRQIKNKFYYKNGKLSKDDVTELQLQIIGKRNFNALSQNIGIAVPWARIYKKEFLNKKNIRFVEKMRRMQDAIFNLYAFELAEHIYIYNEYVYHFRKNSESITYRYSPKTIEYCDNYLKELELFIEKYNKDYKYNKALEYRRMYCIEIILRNYYFNKKCKLKYKQKRREILDLLKKNQYKISTSKLDTDKLSIYQYAVWVCIKNKFIFGLYMCTKLRLIIKSLQSKKLG